MLLLPWCWRAVVAGLLEGVLGGRVLGRFLLRGLRFPDEGREWNKARARVYVPKGIRLLKGTGAGAEPGLKKWTMCWIA